MYRGGYDTGVVEYHLSKCDNVKVKAGYILAFITWGGGGVGNPLERPAETVALEVTRGLVTSDGALRYGVVCNASGKVNEDATKKLRKEMQAKRPKKTPVFNKGRDMKTIMATCEEETHLTAPRPPVFQPDNQLKQAAE